MRSLLLALVVMTGVLLTSCSSENIKSSGNTAIVPQGSTLVLGTWDYEQSFSLYRQGNTIVITYFIFSYSQPLCGVGCTVKTTVGLFYTLEMTENADGSVTVTWPWGLIKR